MQMTGGAVPLTSLAEASSSPASKFAEAVNSGDLYYIRALQTGSPVAPVASIPSRCWATAAASAQLHLHTLDNGALTAVSFLAPCSTSSAAVADVNALSVPTINVVHVVRPQLAPELSMPAPTGALPQQQQQQTQPTTEKGGTDDDGGAPPPPPKDDRTWLQKNWLPVALVAFMFANRLGQAAPPPPQAPASGRR